MKLCLVSSPGGHLAMMVRLKPWWNRHERFWITHLESGQIDQLAKERVVAGCFPENRNIYNFFRNLFLALRVLVTDKPEMIVSMGAGIAVPFILVGKLLGIKTVFIEPLITISKPTLSGKLLYPWADVFIVQTEELQQHYPQALLLRWGL